MILRLLLLGWFIQYASTVRLLPSSITTAVSILQLSYKGYRTCLSNHIESISHHITPLIIKASGMNTHTNTYNDVHTETILRNQVHRPAASTHQPATSNQHTPACSQHKPGLKNNNQHIKPTPATDKQANHYQA